MIAVERPFLAIGFDLETGQSFWDHVMAKTEAEAKIKIAAIRAVNYQPVSAHDVPELEEMTALLRGATPDSVADGLEQIQTGYAEETEAQVEDLSGVDPGPLMIPQ